MRVVIDTNVVVSGLFWRGTPAVLIEACLDHRLGLVVSVGIVEEYERTIAYLERKYPSGTASRSVFQRLMGKVEIVEAPHLHPVVCTDPDDDKFLATALAANVRYVVSGDKALLAVKSFGRVRVVTPRVMLDQISS